MTTENIRYQQSSESDTQPQPPVGAAPGTPYIVDTFLIDPPADAPEGNFWRAVHLLLMSDGTVRWRNDA